MLRNGSRWVFGGSVKAEITGGSNFERHLYFVEAGSADLRVTHAGTPIVGGRTATDVHLLPVSNTFDSAPPDQTISTADITIAHADVNRRMTGLSYAVKGASSIADAAGSFATTIDGVGSVELVLAVKSPLTIDASTTRFRPSAGIVTLTSADFSFEVEYGAEDKVTIRVDNGKDGSVDRTVVTTVAALDALLTAKSVAPGRRAVRRDWPGRSWVARPRLSSTKRPPLALYALSRGPLRWLRARLPTRAGLASRR